MRVASAKVGPDYIDAAFQRAASGGVCVNLDAWGMRPQVLMELAASASIGGVQLLVAEGAMGLFDGARDGSGTTADIAKMTGWPIVLVVDGRGTGQSVGAMIKGFDDFRKDVSISAVLLNRIASPLHRRLLEAGCREAGIEVVGAIPESRPLHLPHRHLGLVQANEHPDLEAFLELGARTAEGNIDMERLLVLARPLFSSPVPKPHAPFPPPAQHIAVAKDVAFAFSYPAWFDAWRQAGAEISFFSPLANQAPREDAGFIFLPGGYPELYAGRLAASFRFLQGLRDGASRGAFIYGECGGYLAMGRGLTDKRGTRHELTGLLPLESRFQQARNLGYRRIRLSAKGFLGEREDEFRGHEFHFVEEMLRDCQSSTDLVPPLFSILPPCQDGEEEPQRPAGMRVGNIMGSFLHLIDRFPAPDGLDENVPSKRIGPDNAPSRHAGVLRAG